MNRSRFTASVRRQTTVSCILSSLLLMVCANAASTTTSSPDDSPISPTVITHSDEVTVSWQILTHDRGLIVRLYASDISGFRLLAEGPAELGSRTYEYIDHARYSTPVVYQLRWVDRDGQEMTVATVLRVDAQFSPAGTPSQSMNRIDSGAQASIPVCCIAPIEQSEDQAARMADLHIPSPEVPPPRTTVARTI